MVARTPEEQERIKEILEKEGLEEFFEEVVKSHDHNAVLNEILELKRKLQEIISKYDNKKIAFEKAKNTETYIHIETDRGLEIPSEEPLIMTFEEFVEKYHPNLIWHKKGIGNYSALMGKYRFFAKNYKVVIFKLENVREKDALRIALKLSKNIYPISRYSRELSLKGFILFVP
jgi:Holliday junction resolvasome RuvABC endonuclease subunit